MDIPIVCEKCGRVYRDGEWVIDFVPIQRVNSTICPHCRPSGDKGDKSKKGMVFQESRRSPKTKK